ncbi:BTAD domain-containing putative transcriptional regulator [Streptosporangium sp. NPDC002721]|uniref:AfsR/SARP family transcriptional regulator n=1 Tax=Streptosporangium sp. NPDC002721 TaxID=3366188 RepID=UPI0036CBCECE
MGATIVREEAEAGETTFAVLGPLEARRNGSLIPLGPFKQRVLLSLLLCHANRIVPVNQLSTAAWSEEPPRTALKNVQVYVSALRKNVLGTANRDRLTFHPPGYQLRLGPQHLDILVYENLARRGRQHLRDREITKAVGPLHEALKLWRGDPLPDMAHVPLISGELARLRNERMSVYEDWAEAELILGHHAHIVDSLEENVRSHPLRERLRSTQMIALFRCGRQSEALAQYEDMRQTLARDLGLRPSPVLERLYRAILAGAPSLDGPPSDGSQHLDATPFGGPRRGGAAVLRPPSPTGNGPEVVAHLSQLPRDLADFTGRRETVRNVLDVFRDPRHSPPVVISGPAGAGKTALAVHAAHLLRERFPDGQLFVRLRTAGGRERSVPDVLAEILRLCGFDGDPPRRAGERVAACRAWLAERSILLILDEASSAAQIRPLLPGTGDNGVLITGRRRLSALESAHHVELRGFTPGEGVELLRRTAGAERVDADPAAALRVVGICDNLPLAVRIAGARLAASPHVLLPLFAGHLTDEHSLLDGLSVDDLSMRACAATYERDLGPDLWASLRRLGALPTGEFTVDDLAALLGSDARLAAGVADKLVEAHVVTVVAVVAAESRPAPVYLIADWLRLYARERLEREESATQRTAAERRLREARASADPAR